MLITTLQELEAVYPTSQWMQIDTLKPLFLKTERTSLVNYLGLPLLKILNKQYAELVREAGGITALHIADPQEYEPKADVEVTAETLTPLTIDVLRICQEIIIYITLSDNVRILTSSLNQGGGFNTMETASYDQSSDTQLKALKDDLWHSAMKSLDALLVLLEDDALTAKQYSELWKESDYYYMHSDLIFRTSKELSHYLPIDNGRATYIRLTSGLRNAQNQFIETRIGHELVGVLCKGEKHEGASELFEVFARHIRMALANYTYIEYLRLKGTSDKNSTQSRARSEMQSDYHEYGDREMGLALNVLFQNPAEFKEIISQSSILQYEYQRHEGSTWQSYLDSVDGPSEETTSEAVSCCDCLSSTAAQRKKYDNLFDFGGLHLM